MLCRRISPDQTVDDSDLTKFLELECNVLLLVMARARFMFSRGHNRIQALELEVAAKQRTCHGLILGLARSRAIITISTFPGDDSEIS